jgi:hypothetical protein
LDLPPDTILQAWEYHQQDFASFSFLFMKQDVGLLGLGCNACERAVDSIETMKKKYLERERSEAVGLWPSEQTSQIFNLTVFCREECR